MNKIIPITIRLEIQFSSSFIKLEFDDPDEVENKISTEEEIMVGKRKQKKMIAHAKIGGNGLPPVAVDDKKTESDKQTPNQVQCFGNRKYAEVVVQTFTEEQGVAASSKQESSSNDNQVKASMQTVPSTSSLSSKANAEGSSDVEKISFFSGNPFIEKTSGILHFYKEKEAGSAAAKNDCSMLCMLGVPTLLTCRELLKFVAPCSQYITAMKVVRDSTPNQYMVIIKFQSHDAAVRFYDEYNGVTYNAIEPEQCSLVFVKKIESVREEAGGSLPIENMTELPTCVVCLERMDDHVLTVLCNHTFHAGCLEQWADTSCPVCRHSQTPELVPDQKCSICGKTTDLWICIVCGNIGCGRYAQAHAQRHFEATSHTFALEIGGERVWDYAADNYVHRLIQNSSDGKMVEYRRSGENTEEKIESMQLEYTYMLTSQLECQRVFYENKMNEQERLFSTLEKHNQAQVDELERRIQQHYEEYEEMKKILSTSKQQQYAAEKKQQATQIKLNKALAELGEERALNKLLRSDQEKWSSKLAEIEAKNAILQETYTTTVNDLREQIRDLMMHFEAETKIKDAVEKNEVTEQEIIEGSVVAGKPSKRTARKNRKRGKK